MTTTHTPNALDNPFQLLRTLRDELKVRAHLAGKEAGEAFAKLDVETDKLLRAAERTSKEKLDELIGKLQKLRGSIGK